MKSRDEIMAGLKRVPTRVIGEGAESLDLELWKDLVVSAEWGDGWDHVALSSETKTPPHALIGALHRVFFLEYEEAMQYYPAENDVQYRQPHTVHLWRSHDGQIPRPPVGAA